jgi:hypothetical protein
MDGAVSTAVALALFVLGMVFLLNVAAAAYMRPPGYA